MTRKQRFFIVATLSALLWAVTLMYIFGSKHYILGVNGNFIEQNPPAILVMLVTLIATGISAGLWHWYRQNRVERALTGLNAEERRELHTRLVSEELSIHDDEDYDVVLTPRKRKLSDE